MSEETQGLPAVATREVPLTYAPFDWSTHPIDTAPDQPQGWGPLSGPWMPVDYADPSQMIDATWDSGDNAGLNATAPLWDELTLYDDHSLDFIFNSSAGVVALDAIADANRNLSSTISNVVRPKQGISRILGALGYKGEGTT